MLGIRLMIRFLEVGFGISLAVLQMEEMKEDISPTITFIMNSAVTSMMVSFMFRFEASLFDKRGFFKEMDMIFSAFAAWAYGVSAATHYQDYNHYLDFYKGGVSATIVFLLLIDTMITWCSTSEDDILPRRGSRRFYMVVARQTNVPQFFMDQKDKENPFMLLTGISKADADVWYSKPRYMRPWGKVYTRVQDEAVTEEKLRELLKTKADPEALDKEVLTPQERLLRAIEIKREVAAAIREQRRDMQIRAAGFETAVERIGRQKSSETDGKKRGRKFRDSKISKTSKSSKHHVTSQ